MPIAGERPESGVRIALERDKLAPSPWVYEGAAYTPSATFGARVVVLAEGEVVVTLQPDGATGEEPPAALADKVRLIVRTLHRQAAAEGRPPAWRIVRWRGEK